MFEFTLAWTDSAFFGLALTLAAYAIGLWMHRKFPYPYINPLVIAVILCTAILSVFHIPLQNYNRGAQLITLLMLPGTISLALPVYRNRKTIKRYALAIFAGCLAGAGVSIGVVYALSHAFALDAALMHTLLPKSVTTPIAVELSAMYGGIPSLTVAAVVLTGMLTAVFAPLWIKLTGLKHPIAVGLSIGTSGHAIGTSSALQMGEQQGAASSIAMGVTGILTALLFLFLF